MNLPTEVFGDVIVVHAPDELGEDQTASFGEFVDRLERHRVVLDLDPTELLDSAGLEALLDAQEHLREAGGDLKISTSVGANRKILEITQIDEQLEVFQSVIDAVKSFQ